jgi:hypothetical protein
MSGYARLSQVFRLFQIVRFMLGKFNSGKVRFFRLSHDRPG